MADFGTALALGAKENFNQKRQDRLKALEFSSQRVKELEKDVQEQAKAQSGIQQYINKLSQLDVLAPAVDKIKKKEKKLRQNVIDELQKYNGDSKKFIAAGGQATLEEYRQNLMMSEEVQNAVTSKQNYMQWVKDKSEGKQPLWFNPIEAGRGNQDPIKMEDMMERYRDGDIEVLPYKGAFDLKDINPEFFAETPNPKGEHIGGPVSQSYLKGHAAGKGYSEEAIYQMQRTFQHPQKRGDTIFSWKKEPYDWTEIQARQELNSGESGKYEWLQKYAEMPSYEHSKSVKEWRDEKTGIKMVMKRSNVGSINAYNSIPYTNNEIYKGSSLMDDSEEAKFIKSHPVANKNMGLGVPEDQANSPHVVNPKTMKPMNMEGSKMQLASGKESVSSNFYSLDQIKDASPDEKRQAARTGFYKVDVITDKQPSEGNRAGFTKVDKYAGPDGVFRDPMWRGEVLVTASVRRPGAAAFSEEQNIDKNTGSFMGANISYGGSNVDEQEGGGL